MKRRDLLLGAAAAGALAGCGGGGTDRTKAQVRLVNASSGYPQLDLRVDDDTVVSNVGYGANASYTDVDPDDTDDTVIAQPNSATALLSLSLTVEEDTSYTLLAYGKEGSLKSLLLTDETDEPASGRALLRVLNAAPDAGNLDIYLTAAGDTLTGAVALQSAAAYGTLGSFVTTTATSWRLRITAAGSKTDVRLDATLTLSSEDVTTLVVTSGSGGLLVNALLLIDEGSIQRIDNSQARLRTAATAVTGTAITASVNGTTLLNGSSAPAINASYLAVNAGTASVAVTVGGTAVTLTNQPLDAGGDYTLLVSGSAAAPLVKLIADDNRLPTDATQVKLRLVHGLGDLAATLALKLDFQPLVDGVAPQTASDYVLVDAASESADLEVTTPAVATALKTLLDQTLTANSVYSLFVGGSGTTTTTVTAILKKDR